jgi:hypothetical protein
MAQAKGDDVRLIGSDSTQAARAGLAADVQDGVGQSSVPTAAKTPI